MIGTFIGGCYLGFLFDQWLINLILKEIPKSGAEWLGIINIVLWVVAVFFTGTLIISVSAFVAGLFSLAKGTPKPRPQPKSRFQERLEKMAKERNN